MSIACLEKYRLDSYRGLRNEYLDALNAEQIFTVTEFLMLTPEDIMRITMMDHNEYEKFVDEIFCRCRPQWTTLTSVVQIAKRPVLTGIKRLDEMLEGGLHCGEILELYGLSGSGKSQVCHYIAAYLCHQEKSSVAYLDASNDFNPLHFYELCEGCEESFQNLCLFRGSKIGDAQNFLRTVETRLRGGDSAFSQTVKLIVIDSLPIIMYPLLTSVDDSSRVFQERLSQSLKKLAATYSLVVIVTNHAVADQRDGGRGHLGKLKPALGQYWFDVPNWRIFLSRTGSSEIFSAQVTHSSRTPEGKTVDFKILNAGIT